MLTLLRLFFEFFKTGLFAVGGGLATMPFLYNISETTGWFSKNDLTNMIAVSESTPGPLGVNMATYVGFSVSGVVGSIVATLGLICPALVIIVIISKFLKKFKQNPYVEAVFHTIRPTSTGLIVGACWGVVEITMFYLDKYNITSKFVDLFNFKSIIFAFILFFLIKGLISILELLLLKNKPINLEIKGKLKNLIKHLPITLPYRKLTNFPSLS